MLAYTPTGSHVLRSPLASPTVSPPPYLFNHQPLPKKRSSTPSRTRNPRASSLARYSVNALLACLLFVILYFSFAKSFKQVAQVQLPPSSHLESVVSTSTLQIQATSSALEVEWQWAANVSFVYTWVNGSEAVYAAKRVKAGGKLGGERDRDTGDLRFSLRSLQKYAPWHTGTVYLVSPANHIPDWLDRSNPRFVHIDQDSIVPKEDQPTFNSNCIEQFFHLIPGLTEQFVVFNDDYFLKKPTHPRVFFTQSRGLRFYPEPGTLGIARTRPEVGSHIWTTSVRLTASVIEEAYPSFHNTYETRITEHAPFVYSKEGFKGAHSRFNDRLRETCSKRFRDEEDILWPIIFQAYTVFEGSRCCGIEYSFDQGKATFLRWTQNKRDNEHRWHDAQSRDVYFFNVNDDMRTGPGAVSATEQLIQKLEAAYPEPSLFEIPLVVEPVHEAEFARSDQKIMDPALR